MNYKEIDGIKIYNPEILDEHKDFDAKHLDKLYEAENNLFWSIYRKQYILEKFNYFINKESNIIEIGAGTGNVSRYLIENGFKNISVGEMHMNGLRYAQTYGITNCYQFDLLKSRLENVFDVVAMFDVLEHIEDDRLALKQCYNMITSDGYLVIVVPSHMWLWNRSDRIVGHKRRYEKRELLEKVESAGFKAVEVKYFFLLLTPLLFIRKLIDRDDGSEVRKDEEFKYMNLSKFTNRVLSFICYMDKKLERYLPNICGGSLFIIGKK